MRGASGIMSKWTNIRGGHVWLIIFGGCLVLVLLFFGQLWLRQVRGHGAQLQALAQLEAPRSQPPAHLDHKLVDGVQQENGVGTATLSPPQQNLVDVMAAVRWAAQLQLLARRVDELTAQLQKDPSDTSVHPARSLNRLGVGPTQQPGLTKLGTLTSSPLQGISPSMGLLPYGIWSITSFPDEKCLETSTKLVKARVRLAECQATLVTQVMVYRNGLLQQHSRCLEVVTAGLAVETTMCDGESMTQQWLWHSQGGRHRPLGTLINKKTGLCLAADANGVIVVQACLGTCNQSFVVPGMLGAAAHPVQPSAGAMKRPGKAGRVLCWVMTNPDSHRSKAVAVNQTWGRHCDVLIFVSSKMEADLPILNVFADGPESRELLWAKSKLAWTHIYEHYVDKMDWFMRADDDTYIVWAHLQDFLAKIDPEEPRHFGRLFLLGGNKERSFYSGGPGIILSRGALQRLGKAALADPHLWGENDYTADDVALSEALLKVGVPTESSLDENQRQLFMAINIKEEREQKYDANYWFWNYSPDARSGPQCCSEHWVGNHYTSPAQMFLVDDVEHSQCVPDPDMFPFLRLKKESAALNATPPSN